MYERFNIVRCIRCPRSRYKQHKYREIQQYVTEKDLSGSMSSEVSLPVLEAMRNRWRTSYNVLLAPAETFVTNHCSRKAL